MTTLEEAREQGLAAGRAFWDSANDAPANPYSDEALILAWEHGWLDAAAEAIRDAVAARLREPEAGP